MLITLETNCTKNDVEKISNYLNQRSLSHCISEMEASYVLGVENNLPSLILEELHQIAPIAKVIPTSSLYKLASTTAKKENTVISIKNVVIGGRSAVMMAGPCAIESLEQLITLGMALKKIGVSVLRGSAFKPRTSPYSFQGTGFQGLQWHKEAQKEHQLLIETEVLDTRDVEEVAKYVDIIRVGARNMQNFNLLKEVGQCGKPVILKRGISATLEEWLLSAEYIIAHGNPQVILCERGIRTFENSTRNTLDLSSVAVAQLSTHLPIIVDPTHAAGRKDIIPALSRAAIALGADGLLIEVHDRPQEAKCDGFQALLPSELEMLMLDLRKVALSIGRTL
jgi:3-deoxy-7-phosphoheptulonate synthase